MANTDTYTDLPNTKPDQMPNPEYETQDRLIDRRGFLLRMGVLGTAGVALTQLPPIAARKAQAAGFSSVAVEVRPEAIADPTECTVAEAATLISQGQLKPSELTEAYLQRIALYEGDYYQAYMTVLADESRAIAARLDDMPIRSPIHGVSIPVKDNFWTAGVLTTAQSLIFQDFVPTEDSTAVARIKAAGGIVLGKLQMGPLAGGRPRDPLTGVATTRNAWAPNDVSVSPSGSSGGSGTCTAARLATCSLGTQTGGSIIGPASSAGLTALKPTHGRASVFGVIPLTITRDHIGPLARDAKDAAIVTEVISGPAPEDPRTIGLPPVPDLIAATTPVVMDGMVVPRYRLRVGVPGNYLEGDTPAAQARREMVDLLANIGYDVVSVTIPEEYSTLSSGPFNVSSSERAEMDFEFLKRDVRLFGDRLGGWIPSLLLGGAEVAKGLRCRMRAIELAFTGIFNQCDVIFSTTGMDAIGFPIASYPIGYSPNANGIVLPITATISGPAFAEENLLSMIAAYQAVTNWHTVRPVDPVLGLNAASNAGAHRLRIRSWDSEREDERAMMA